MCSGNLPRFRYRSRRMGDRECCGAIAVPHGSEARGTVPFERFCRVLVAFLQDTGSYDDGGGAAGGRGAAEV